MLELNEIYNADSLKLLKEIQHNSIHLILSDIPYGIGVEDWDILHNNKNSAYLGTSPAQQKAGLVFKKRGKPLNGWSEEDKFISMQYYEWVSSWCKDWFNILLPGGNVFVFAGRRMAHRCISAFEDVGFTFKDMLAWNKEQAPYRAQRISIVYERRNDLLHSAEWEGWRVGNLRPIFEPILWFTKPYKLGGTIADNLIRYGTGAYNETVLSKYNQHTDNVFYFKSKKSDSGLHPTQKPLALMKLLVELTTRENDIVVDPFAGSGTTLIASLQLNRSYIGVEKDQEYFLKAKERLASEREQLDYRLL